MGTEALRLRPQHPLCVMLCYVMLCNRWHHVTLIPVRLERNTVSRKQLEMLFSNNR